MKTALSLFWRVLLLQFLFSLVMVLALTGSPLMGDVGYVHFKPTVMFASFAVVLGGFQLLTGHALPFFLLGKRLGKTDAFWRNLTVGLVAFYVVLAFANLLVARLASFDTWVMIKTFGPVPALLAFLCWLSSSSMPSNNVRPART